MIEAKKEDLLVYLRQSIEESLEFIAKKTCKERSNLQSER